MTAPIANVGGAAATTAATQTQAAKTPDSDQAKAMQGFERELVGQLTKQLVDSAMPQDDQASAATNTYRQMLPDALTEALMSGGGIGLAKELSSSLGKASS